MGLSSLCSLCARHYDGSRWFQHKLWGGMGRTFTAIQCFSMLFLFLDWCLARWLRRHHLFKSPTSTPKSTITMVPTQTNWTEQHRTTLRYRTIALQPTAGPSWSAGALLQRIIRRSSAWWAELQGSKKYHFWIRFKLSKKKQSYKLATGVK